jgi:hypothetical protein
MPRYIVERNFSAGLHIPVDEVGARACRRVVDNNAKAGVTWILSYVREDLGKSFCVYDAPDAEAIRTVAGVNELPADIVTPVRVLDPYFYLG